MTEAILLSAPAKARPGPDGNDGRCSDPRPETNLSALEWSVVALARIQPVRSLREPGRIASAFGALFGRSSGRAVPDPRLEALRRVAVFAWHHGWRVPTSELRAFLAAGFSLDQYELVQNSVARGRAAARRKAYP